MALRRYLVLGEETELAWVPDWYPVLKAAQYMHISPMELLDAPIYWRDRALKAQTAELQAREQIDARG